MRKNPQQRQPPLNGGFRADVVNTRTSTKAVPDRLVVSIALAKVRNELAFIANVRYAERQ